MIADQFSLGKVDDPTGFSGNESQWMMHWIATTKINVVFNSMATKYDLSHL